MYIGQKMAKYDYGIIHVQDDFYYHAVLYKYDNHPFRTATSGGAFVGSGLNTLSKYNWIDFSRISWDECSASWAVCIRRRGFSLMRVRIDEGVYIDLINLRINQRISFEGEVERRSNIRQLADFIEARSAGNAVIVFGDTGSLYARSGNNIRLLTARHGLTDAWVRAIGGMAPATRIDPIVCLKGVPANIHCEVVDKVLYRGSSIIDLKSSGFFYDTSRFLSPEGNMLTDRHPVRVEFGYTLKSKLRQSDLYGGPHGTWFNDILSIPESPKLSSITLRGANRLDGLTLTLVSGQAFVHGGSGGSPHSITLASGEYITSVKLCWGQKDGHTRNFYAQATTNEGRSLQAGKRTDDCATATAPSGYGVVGAYGQDGEGIDQLGFIYAQQ
ncbi:unnamed protein product [Rhizoctonia solani]|uniref:Jacalin-type lectin domain-containing protein n=1 Tax=Rhizoctonia solani TaxID=456999 RepID=A0A8H3EBA9_9AGAM|nr:unnamed protein product [Rhizoctonia solani]